jgi:glyoxylase-like metal-dependent hydrolase (beta-lactamase superfamily II)
LEVAVSSQPPRYSRRLILQSGPAAAAYVLGTSGPGLGALAQTASESRAATHHRFTLGTRDIFVLSDGHLVVPAGVLAVNVPDAEVRSFLAARAMGPEVFRFHINVALVKTGADYVLIDAGSGGTWEQTAGKLSDSLEAAGIKPEQIGKVVLTHAHPDHIWGLIDEFDDSLRFPRAQYVVAAKEFDFWTMGEAARLTGPIEGIAAGARRVFKKIEDRTVRIKPGDEIAPGMVMIDTAGHTPGHMSVLIDSGSHKLLVTADAIQNAHVAFAHPDWHPRADMDGDRAAKSRRELLDIAATDKLRVLCYHIPFPGIGRVERQGTAFRWLTEV